MSSSSTTTTRGSALKWSDLLNESVHTDDDHDIGDIEAVNREFVVIKRGFVNVHRYFIPAEKIAGWNGNVLWLKITEEEVKRKYQNDLIYATTIVRSSRFDRWRPIEQW
jgi:hypothetical protein